MSPQTLPFFITMMSLFLDNLLIISWSLYITFSFEYLNSSWISYFTLICLALLDQYLLYIFVCNKNLSKLFLFGWISFLLPYDHLTCRIVHAFYSSDIRKNEEKLRIIFFITRCNKRTLQDFMHLFRTSLSNVWGNDFLCIYLLVLIENFDRVKTVVKLFFSSAI